MDSTKIKSENLINKSLKNETSSSVDFLYLSQEAVIGSGGLNMKMAIEAVERAFRLLNEG